MEDLVSMTRTSANGAQSSQRPKWVEPCLSNDLLEDFGWQTGSRALWCVVPNGNCSPVGCSRVGRRWSLEHDL